MSRPYAGDLPPQHVFERLTDEADAVLVDVRTAAEWTYVGVPDLSSIGKQVVLAEWIQFPDGMRNPDFLHEVKEAVGPGDPPIFFLCRSGVRSMGAAEAMTQAGYSHCHNVTGGFEGDKDAEAHRGKTNGWKVAGLPWRQG